MTAAKDPVPAAAISAGEDAIWIFAQGKRLPLKLSLLPATGLKYLPRGTPQPWGVPLEPPTLLPRNSLACATVRSDDFDTASAVLFDVNTGRVKWERTLGLPAAAPPVPVSGGAIVVDTAAGIARVADAATTLAEPVQPAMTAALVATAGERVWAVIAESPEANGVRLRVRCVEAGRLTIDVSLAVPKGLAGAPMPISDDLLLALKDGFLHRFSSISKQLSTGPMWRDAVAEKSATCLAAVQGDTILASDGGRRVGRWRWPATTAWSVIGPPLVARGEVVLPPLALDNRVLVAEAAALSLFDVAKPEEPVRRWRSPAMPAGTPRLGVTAFGKLAIIALDARHVVAIDPDSPTPAWMIERPAADSDLAGMSVANGELIVTDLLGAVQRISPAGKVLGRIAPRSRDWLPRTAAAVSGSAVFLPTVDGAVLKLPFMKGSP
jgi:outer membrane protein assembly factor BamB